MQAGHIAVALTISSFAPELTGGKMVAFSGESIAVAMAAHWLPNLDVIPIWLKWAKASFHCTWSHSLLLLAVVGLILLPIDFSWFVLGTFSLLLHFLADMPSSVGLPLLMPFSYKRYSLNLWADTGHSGWEALKGTYIQAWTWILEGGAYLVLFIRLYQKNLWPFS
jgi:membrane-bound metal-dependent hydrolase YbcI (DUF457 family)